MTGIEIDMIVTDSLEALKLYQDIFEVVPIEVTSLPKGLNEAVFTVYGTRFHLLDENPSYEMFAPKPEDKRTMWINAVVPDITQTWERALAAGCVEIQPVVEMPEMGVKNAMFYDPFGYVWMLHEIVREVSFEERSRVMEKQLGIER